MRRLAFREKAKDDLLEIHSYVARDNPRITGRFVESIDQRCRKLALTPFMGRARPDIADGLRSIPFGNFQIFYSVTDDAVIIDRVLHARRRVEGQF